MSLNTSEVINMRYRIVKLLGQGGFGAVYRAYDLNLKKPVALKENLETSLDSQRQFNREATVLSHLTHPHLPRVTDYFIVPGQGQYLVMDFVDGEDLQGMVERLGPLDVQKVLTWAGEVLDALMYMHSQNPPVIHRDIKPANIRITPEGKAVLVDFGLVKLYDAHQRTTTGARAVTAGFSPPEQYGQANTDARTDVYALGATLYMILTGKEPPESTDRVGGGVLVPASQYNPRVSPALWQCIERAMQIVPARRFQTAAEFKAALPGIPGSMQASAPRPSPGMVATVYDPQIPAMQSVQPPVPAYPQPPAAQPVYPQAAYPQPPIPAPVPGPYAAAQANDKSWAATASMVLAILNIVLMIIPYGCLLSPVLLLLALIFGIIGMKSRHRGQAIAGLVITLVSIALLVILILVGAASAGFLAAYLQDLNGSYY